MDTYGSGGHGAEQRTLASVMFTDVVGFSKLSAIDEEKTYAALNRDFDLIYSHIAAHGGQVLNTMGDGMMVVFTSAIDCIRCARAIQESLHQQTLSRPVHGVLQHRIGIHAGDIILNGRNTMGDTVNQAARIQSLARPDSIAMSRDFHDLIKGKTNLDIGYLGPRMTKNIPVPIPIHEIPPIDDAIRQQLADSLFVPPPADTRKEATGRKSLMILLTSVILVGAATAPIIWLGTVSKSVKNQGIVIKPGSIKDDPNALKRLNDRLKKDGDANNAPADANTPPLTTTDTNTAVTFALKPAELTQIETLLQSKDFSGIVTLLKAIPGADTADGQAMIAKYEGLANFREWLMKEVSTATSQAPINATIEGYASQIYNAPEGVIIVANEQVSTPKNLWEWKNSTLVAIAEACATNPPTKTQPPAELSNWLNSFKEIQRN